MDDDRPMPFDRSTATAITKKPSIDRMRLVDDDESHRWFSIDRRRARRGVALARASASAPALASEC